MLQLLYRERTEKFKVLLSPFVDALLRDSRWSEITALLDNTKELPINPLNIAQLRARCAYGTGAPSKVVHDLLEQARRLAVASKESFALEQLTDIALSMGQDEVALGCLRAITASTPLQQEQINSRILSIQMQHGDLNDALATLSETSGSSLPSPADAERLIYFKLIAGVEQETVMEQCEQLVGRGLIKTGTFQFFRALHAYRQGDRVTLQKALDQVEPATLPTNWRGVSAGLLAIAGEKARAFQLAEKITPAVLSPDEQRILAEAL